MTAQLDASCQGERIQKVLLHCILPAFFGVWQLTQSSIQHQPRHISLILSQAGTSGCSCLGFCRPPRRGTVLLPVWGMKTRKKGETGMHTFLPFLLGELRSSSTASWGNASFKTSPALSSNAFAPTPFLWLSKSWSPHTAALLDL